MMKFSGINPNLRNILVKADLTEHCLAITTYDRLHGRRGRFLICRDSLEAWMEDPGNRSFYDTDCGHFLKLHQDVDCYVISIHWLSEYSDGEVRGFRQRFTLPAEPLFDLLMCGGKPISWLSTDGKGTTKIDASHAVTTIRRVCGNRRQQRALSKAMRDCFQWRGDEVVTLYPDGGSNFYFTTKSGRPKNGGLILHESTVQTAQGKLPKIYYSVHT